MPIYNCQRTVSSHSQYLISPLTIVYKHMLILLFIMNLKMTVGRSKRRSFLTLTFLVKSVCKNLLSCLFRETFVLRKCKGNHLHCRWSFGGGNRSNCLSFWWVWGQEWRWWISFIFHLQIRRWKSFPRIFSGKIFQNFFPTQQAVNKRQ